MRHIRLAVVVLGLIWATACSSTNSTDNTQPLPNVEKFSVSTEQGSGTFNPVLDVVEQGNTTTVTVTAQQASDLAAAYVHLNYDESKYTPTSVEFGDFLGKDGEVITLALTDIAGAVPMGVCQIGNSGAAPQNGSGVLATVTFTRTPFVNARGSSSFPAGNGNKVDDLKIVSQEGGYVYLRWTEKNKGDYDNNGLVGISDMSPLGLYFNQSVADANDPTHASLVDGDGNGLITLGDLSVIGGNFDNQLTGYWLFKDDKGSDPVVYIERPTGIDTKKPVIYNHDLAITGTEKFVVRGVGTTEAELGMASNVAQLTVVPGPPNAPTNLTATAGIGVGNLKIRLNWTASDSADVAGYFVERKLASDPDSSFAEVAGPLVSVTYLDQTGLTEADYTYRVRASDQELVPLFSDYTAAATARPYVKVISPPISVTAVPAPAAPVSIKVDWDAPADGSAERYTLYRQAPGEVDFTAIFSTLDIATSEYTDGGLTEGENYSYYVTSRDAFLTAESAPSATKTSQSSSATILDVTLSTDKTTHHTGGSEPDSNITATSNTPGTNFAWSASYGAVTGSGANVTWAVPGSATVQVVTITCNASFGPQTDIATLKLYLTSEAIKKNYNIGDSGTIGLNGKFIDFSRPMVEKPAAPFKSMSDFIDGDHVVLYNLWEIWCPPCRDEMDMMHEWAVDYEAHKYYHVGHASTYGLSSGTPNLTTWLSTPGAAPVPPQDTRPWNKFHTFNQSVTGTGQQWAGDMPLWQQYWSGYGNPGMSLPRTLLFDKDGYCRYFSSTIPDSAETTWRNLIKSLTGAP